MAYMRGDYYLWDDENGLHIWVKDGYDGWREAAWGREENCEITVGWENASGLSIPMDVMDAYVMMRLAQIIKEGTVENAITRAVSNEELGGNVGSLLLKKNADLIRKALQYVELDLYS